MSKLSSRWIAIIAVSFLAADTSGCALSTAKRTGMAFQLDQEYMAPSSGVTIDVLIDSGHRYYCQTYAAGRDGVLAALSVGVRALRFARISRYDPVLLRTVLLPARLFPQYNLSISLFSVQEGEFCERLLDFQIPCDNAKFETDDPGRALDTVILLPKQVEQRKGQKYSICAYYPDAPWPGGVNAGGRWAGGVNVNSDQEIVCSDDGIHWDFRCWPNRSLNFRTFTVSTCEQPESPFNPVDKDFRAVESAMAIIRQQEVYSQWSLKLRQAFMIGASLDEVSLILGRRPDTCVGIEPTPKLGAQLNADGSIALLSQSGAGAKSGLSAGERIVTVNGIDVSSAEEVVEAMRTTARWDEISTVSTKKQTYAVHFEKPSKVLKCSWDISEGSSMQTGEPAAGTGEESASQAGPSQMDDGQKKVFHASCRFEDGKAVDCFTRWPE